MSVAVVVDKGAAGVPTRAISGDAGFFADVREGAIAVVVVQHVFAEVRNEEIVEAVVVVVADAGSLAPAGMEQAGFGSDVGEGAVAIVLEQMIDGLLTGGKAFEARAVDEKNVEPAVVVVVVESHAAAGSLEEVFVLVLAAENGFNVEAGVARVVEEGDADIVGARFGREGRGGGGIAGTGLLLSKGQRKSKDVLEWEHERGPAQRVEKFAARGSQSNRDLS